EGARRPCPRRPRSPSLRCFPAQGDGSGRAVAGGDRPRRTGPRRVQRNDMVQYFGEQLSGYAFTKHGWVQSYGSRYVRPPLVVGAGPRPHPVTADWPAYAQSLPPTPMTGRLAGPVTFRQWSFMRDARPRSQPRRHTALALRADATDLEKAGTRVIPIEE